MMFFKKYVLIFVSLILFSSSQIFAKGDLAIKAHPLELILGSESRDYDMSTKEFKLETGRAYRLKIKSLGFKEYAFVVPKFFRNIWIRKIEAGDVEIKASVINELEFEDAAEAERSGSKSTSAQVAEPVSLLDPVRAVIDSLIEYPN